MWQQNQKPKTIPTVLALVITQTRAGTRARVTRDGGGDNMCPCQSGGETSANTYFLSLLTHLLAQKQVSMPHFF